MEAQCFPKECIFVSLVSERTQSNSDLDSDTRHGLQAEVDKTARSSDSNSVRLCDSETECQEKEKVACSAVENSHIIEFELPEEITDLMSCLIQALPQYLGDEDDTTELSETQDHSDDVVTTQDHSGDVVATQDHSGDVMATQDHGADVLGTQDHSGDVVATQDRGADVMETQDHSGDVSTRDQSTEVTATQDHCTDVIATQDHGADVMATQDCITDVPETDDCTAAEADVSMTHQTSKSDSDVPHFPDSETVDLPNVLIDVILGSETSTQPKSHSVSSASDATFPENTATTTVELDNGEETKSAETETSDEEEKLGAEEGSEGERAAHQKKDKEERTEDEDNDDEKKRVQLPSDAEEDKETELSDTNEEADDEDSSSDDETDLHDLERLLAMMDAEDWFPDLEDIRDDSVLAQVREYFNECPICLELRRLDTRACCQFKICRGCFQKYLASKVSEGIVVNIQCPNSECHAKLNEYEIATRLTHSLKVKYIKFLTDAKNDPTEKTCPRCGQEEKVEKKLLKKKTTLKKGLRVSCQNCDLEWCFRCHAPWHEGVSCKEYRKGDKEFQEWVHETHERQANAQKCPKCKIYIQRSSGCSHMTCNRCTTEFCYDCGKHYYPRGMHHRVANSRVFRYTLGSHSSKLSPMGCSRNFMPESNAARRLIRGSLLGAKLVGGVCALALAAGAAVVVVTAAPVVWGVAKARKRIRNRRRS